MAVITNRKSAQALDGQSVIVTLNGSDADTYLSTLTVGQSCTATSSSKAGVIVSIDTMGVSFKVRPIMPNTRFDSSSTPGIFATSDSVTT